MATDVIDGRTAASIGRRRPGTPATGQVVVLGGASVLRATPRYSTSRAGALGTALRHRRHPVGVLGNGDHLAADGGLVIDRPAALALMDRAFWLNRGDVRFAPDDAGSILERDPGAPSGVRASVGGVAARTQQLLRGVDVLVVDPGDTQRAAGAPTTDPAERERLREQALEHTDAVLGRVVDVLPRSTLLLVVGVTPPGDTYDLTPIVATGPGVPSGYLMSPSTHRQGLVLLSDLAPTVLSAMGVSPPAGMAGSPIRYERTPPSWDELRGIDRAGSTRTAIQSSVTSSFIVVQIFVYLLVVGLLVALRRRRDPPRPPVRGPWASAATALRFAALALAAWPLATYGHRVLPSGLQLGDHGALAIWALAVLLALAARAAAGRDWLRALQLVCGATVALILIDLSVGAPLQLSSILGYSPQTAGRFTGLGNSGFAVLAASAVTAGLVHVHRAPPERRTEAVAAVGVLFALVVVGDGWPTLGGDVGGTLTLLPVLGTCTYLLSHRRLRWRIVLAAVAGALLLTAGMVGLDLLRPAAERTHLGRFAADVFSDHSTFWPVVARKVGGDLRPFSVSPWTWFVPVFSLGGLYLLVGRRAASRLLPIGSPLRLAVTTMIVLGVVGGLLNDSGVAIAALTVACAGPLLTVVALDPSGPTDPPPTHDPPVSHGAAGPAPEPAPVSTGGPPRP